MRKNILRTLFVLVMTLIFAIILSSGILAAVIEINQSNDANPPGQVKGVVTFGQTFTVSKDGTINFIDLRIAGNPDPTSGIDYVLGKVVLKAVDASGLPTGAVLAESGWLQLKNPDNLASWIRFNMTTPLAAEAGDKFALIAIKGDEYDLDLLDYKLTRDDSYPGGTALDPSLQKQNDRDIWFQVGMSITPQVVNYTVTFLDGDNGTFDPTGAEAIQTVPSGGSATEPTVVPDTGYVFTGWNSDVNPYDLDNITGNLTLTAQYALENHTVTFLEGAHGSFNSSGAEAVQVVIHGGNATPPTVVPGTGYHFTGWVSNVNPYDLNNITGNLTLTAQYAIDEYTVTFLEGAHGTFNPDGAAAVQGVDHGGSVTEPTVVTHVGFAFTGWVSDVNPYDLNNVTGNLTLTAQYEKVKFTVNFLQGAHGMFDMSGAPTLQSVDYGGSVTEPIVIPAYGYHFTGWQASGSGFMLNNITGNYTLTALYAINEYTVTFNSNGGSLVAPAIVEHGAKVPAPAAPTKTGFTFGGWYADTGLTDGWDFTNDVVTGNMTLYAKWVTVPKLPQTGEFPILLVGLGLIAVAIPLLAATKARKF